MGSYYQQLDQDYFDYDLQALPEIPEQKFRGPAFDRRRPYVACIGGAQTFGRFCTRPYPAYLSGLCDFQFLNLGVGGAGPRLFDTPRYLGYLNNAELVIVQVLAGRSESNSLFDNTESGDLFGLRLQDNKRMRFEEFLGALVASAPPDRVTQVVRETQANYVESCIRLLNHIQRPKLLLWLSKRSPDEPEDLTWQNLSAYPQLVTRPMLDEIRKYADGYIECSSSAGIPQELWAADEPIDGARLEGGKLRNYYYPSPIMHVQAAAALAPLCNRYLSRRITAASQQPAIAPVAQAPTQFLILAAERTGSDLLRTLLASHPDCLVGHEIFNEVHVGRGCVPWYPDPATQRYEDPVNFDPELAQLRANDPGRLIERLAEMSAAENYRAAGFKLMYYHGESNRAARDYLVAARHVRVIHVKRRNLLRRLTSLKRAQLTSQWNYRQGSPDPALAPVELDPMQCIEDFSAIEQQQALYDGLFKEHAVLTLHYEDLIENPQKETARVAAFLGLLPYPEFHSALQKQATDTLASAITNYPALKSALSQWASFFDE